MKHLTVDPRKCNGCGYCVVDCPMGIVRMNASGVAESVESNARICLYCGHCVAVCPPGAIVLNELKEPESLPWIRDYGIVPFSLAPDGCEPSERKHYPTPDSLRSLIKSKRINRSYRPQLVDRKTVTDLLSGLKYAPSGHNTRAYHLMVVEGRETLGDLATLTCQGFKDLLAQGTLSRFDTEVFQKIVDAWEGERIDRIFRTAHQMVVAYCDSGIAPFRAELGFCTLLTYFDLLCNSAGLGAAWAGYFMIAARTHEPIKDRLRIDRKNTIWGAMMFGYPQFSYELVPRRPELDIHWL